MITTAISRRHFLGQVGTVAAGLGMVELFGAEPAAGRLRLGMMLQGNSTAELLQKAGDIAAAGFDGVQLTFFYSPTEADLRALADRLKELRLKVFAFGVYFNLFRPDDTGFMGASQAVMKQVAAHAGLFGCRQFVTWSGSHSPRFDGLDPRNESPDAVALMHKSIREIILPIIDPIDGRVAFEPYYPHVFGTIERAGEVMAPFSADRIGLLLDPPNFISPALYPKREQEMLRMFRELGPRIHLVHFKDMKLSSNGGSVSLPGPGDGEMDYPLLVSELRKLKRELPCIIEHINAEPAAMKKTKAWVEKQLQ